MRTARQLSIALLLLLCIGALYISYHLITDPTGSSLGLPFYLLNGTIFSNFVILGWILLITVGLFSGVIIFSIWRKGNHYSFLLMLQGVILIAFVVVQMLLLGETFITQYVVLIIGVALIGLGALQYQRRIIVESERKTNPVAKSHHHKHRKHK